MLQAHTSVSLGLTLSFLLMHCLLLACEERPNSRIDQALDQAVEQEVDQAVEQEVDQALDQAVEQEIDQYISQAIEVYDPLPLVDPFLATGGQVAEIASVSPGASAPNGLTLIGPDTRKVVMIPPYHCAGYHYPDTHIQGFSHTHAHGMGVVDYGGISILPRKQWREEYIRFEGRQAPFSHEYEWASPGQYGVVLEDDQTLVEIVATEHGAHHRFHFNEVGTEMPIVIIDLGDNLETTTTLESSIRLNQEGSEERFELYQRLDGSYSGRFGGVRHYATFKVSPEPILIQGWNEGEEPSEGLSFSGQKTGLILSFPEGTEQVDLRIALSFVDIEGATQNLEAELPDLQFENRVNEVEALWRNQLSKLRVRGSEQDVKRFTTAHYHSLLMPSLNSDIDGRYRGLDQEIHQADFKYYSDFSLWDTFRTLHSLYLLVHPQLQLDMLKSLIQMYEDGGSLPRWPLAHGYTGGMVGTLATQVLAEAALKGLEGWNQDAGFAAALAQVRGEATQATRAGLDAYLNLGWVPEDEQSGSVSRTLEFAWSDDALSRWASQRGDEPLAEELKLLSQNWQNHWDPEQKFMVGRKRNGERLILDSSAQWTGSYVEGNAWHYLWYVPYAVDEMIEWQHNGDREAFVARLNEYWQQVYAEEDDLLPDQYYWHGNEPVLHYAWLGSLADAPELTVAASHHILETRYGHTPADALDGNDDSGTLSAWYLWASMGLYPIAGTQDYVLGAPIFERIEIDRDQEGTLVIEANGADWYRFPITVVNEDKALLKRVITHEQLLSNLRFVY